MTAPPPLAPPSGRCRLAALALLVGALGVGLGVARAEAGPVAIGDTLIAGGAADAGTTAVGLVVVLDGFMLPVSALRVDDAPDLLLVAQLEGLVVVVEDGEIREGPLLDLRHRVTGLRGEQGLFSVALEPAAAAAARGRERQLVAAFTEIDSGDLLIASYDVDDRFWIADETSERAVLRIPMPEPFHHGGAVVFGPDGMLWIGVGDGELGPAYRDRPPWTAQSLDELRGKLLRIDLLPSDDEAPYAVPEDNPLLKLASGRFGEDVRPEIWAFGFRNPWKLHFAPGGELYLADVGEDAWEEVNLALPGRNYGWPSREGPGCLLHLERAGPVDPECDRLELFEDPVVAYAHPRVDPTGGSAVTGGLVVRDAELGALVGSYLFGDFVTGRVWAYDPDAGRVASVLETGLAITGFAEGPRGEVYVLGISGVLARLVPLDHGAGAVRDAPRRAPRSGRWNSAPRGPAGTGSRRPTRARAPAPGR